METIIPILIALVAFGFQAYANFQKEQDKARKRNPSQRRPSDPERQPDGRPTQSTGMPTPEPQYRDGTTDRQPPSRRKVSTPEWAADIPATTPAFEAYTGRVDETKRHTRRPRNRRMPEQVAVTDTESPGGEILASDFDLRDAVIKSAVLTRPYQ